jgi:hypothetical protein
MMSKLQTARTFTLQDWWEFLQAWSLLLVVDLGLRAMPFPSVKRLLEIGYKGGRRLPGDDRRATIDRLQALVRTAARHHVYPMSCLRRALVLRRLLCRRGIAAELQIGVHKHENALRAHAWLQLDGQPAGEPILVSEPYVPLKPLEAG